LLLLKSPARNLQGEFNMTRIFTEGAEMGDILFWTSGAVTNLTTAPRSGNRHFSVSGNNTGTKNITAIAEGYDRRGIYFTSAAVPHQFVRWTKAGTILGSVRLNPSNSKLEIYTSTGTLVATSTNALLINTWYLLETHINIGNSSGSIDARIDGANFVSSWGDTQPGADTTFDQLVATSTDTMYLDDLALNDTAGGADNSWCGDGKIVMLRPTAVGDVTQLTPTSGSNWQCVDEVPPNTTDYVSSATAGQYDLYNCGTTTIAAGDVVKRVQVEARILEESATGDSIKLGVKTESTEYWETGQVVTTAYARYVGNDLTVNPLTNVAWTQTELDDLQIGVTVV
jgi:hypothetical protein